jgi:hypothetical protein
MPKRLVHALAVQQLGYPYTEEVFACCPLHYGMSRGLLASRIKSLLSKGLFQKSLLTKW